MSAVLAWQDDIEGAQARRRFDAPVAPEKAANRALDVAGAAPLPTSLPEVYRARKQTLLVAQQTLRSDERWSDEELAAVRARRRGEK